jgi:hypothetical protein
VFCYHVLMEGHVSTYRGPTLACVPRGGHRSCVTVVNALGAC